MPIRGRKKNVAIVPVEYKDTDRFDTFVPQHFDLFNGRMSDKGSWVKRPGMGTATWDLSDAASVVALIPAVAREDRVLAILSNGAAYDLADTPTAATGTLGIAPDARPQWTRFGANKTLILAAGKTMRYLKAPGLLADVGGSPPEAKFVDVLNSQVIASGYDNFFFSWSSPGDFEEWLTSNKEAMEIDGGTLQRHIVLNGRILFFKDSGDFGRTEVWSPGSVGVTFARQAIIDHGTTAPYSVVKAGKTVYFLGKDGDFYRLVANGAQLISESHGDDIRALAKLTDCYGFDFPTERVIRWYFPTAGKTYVYDYVKGFFSQDGRWVNGGFDRMPIASHVEIPGTNTVYVGHYNPTGKIYTWSTDNRDDDGDDIRVFRRFNVELAKGGNQARLNRVQFRVKRGQVGLSVDPVFILGLRFDGEAVQQVYTFSLGAIGDVYPYVEETALGVGREVEVEMTETDAAGFLVTHMNTIVQELGR